MGDVNVKDIGLKLFWTLVPVIAGFAGAYVTDWNPAMGTAVASVVQVVSSFARQKLGATPPDIQGLPADAEIEAVVVGPSPGVETGLV